jgi:hypothetical protein
LTANDWQFSSDSDEDFIMAMREMERDLIFSDMWSI